MNKQTPTESKLNAGERPQKAQQLTDNNKKRYSVYGPNLGAELHTFSEALEKEKIKLGERQKEDPAALYAPQSGQTLPPKHPYFEGKPTLPDKIVPQSVPFGKISVPCDPISRLPSEAEEAAFSKIWAEIDAKAAMEEAAATQVATERAKAEEHGFTYPVDASQGVSFEEARAWTVGYVGHNKQGYKTIEGFCKWLARVQYSFLGIGRITPKGFALLLQQERERTRKHRADWKRSRKQEDNRLKSRQRPDARKSRPGAE
jgi:hypothetical protein